MSDVKGIDRRGGDDRLADQCSRPGRAAATAARGAGPSRLH